MHSPLPHSSVTRPPSRPPSIDGQQVAPTASDRQPSPGLLDDFWPVAPPPLPDWDWGPDDERRRN